MLKRFTRLPILALIGGLLLASACTAQPNGTPPYTEGNQYVTLPGPAQRYSDDGKVEVVEVFSYGCIHCAEFAPTAEKLRKQLPPGVKFKLLPAPFNAQWLPFARAYYAAKQLCEVDRTHLKLFAKLKRDLELIRKWQVDGTPTIVVDGKYRVAAVHSFDEMSAVTQWLVKRELKGK
jgi:thiol:disulfide interchange protein DsbA